MVSYETTLSNYLLGDAGACSFDKAMDGKPLSLVPELKFSPSQLVFFTKSSDAELMEDLNVGLLNWLRSDSYMKVLRDTTYYGRQGECDAASETEQVNLMQMIGLFVVVAFLVALSIIYALIERYNWEHTAPAVFAAPHCEEKQTNILAELMSKVDRVLENQQERNGGLWLSLNTPPTEALPSENPKGEEILQPPSKNSRSMRSPRAPIHTMELLASSAL